MKTSLPVGEMIDFCFARNSLARESVQVIRISVELVLIGNRGCTVREGRWWCVCVIVGMTTHTIHLGETSEELIT